MNKQLTLVVDVRKCIGCMACTVSCKTLFSTPLGKFRIRVRQFSSGKSANEAKKIFLPLMCFQCEKPACIKACEKTGNNAIYKRAEDGIVVIDKDKCQGKQLCIKEGCPYSNIYFNPETGKAEKCSLCLDREWNDNEIPECVLSCSGKALIFGDIRNSGSDVGQAVRKYLNEGGKALKIKNTPDGTRPSVIYLGIEDWIKTINEELVGFKELNPKEIFEDVF